MSNLDELHVLHDTLRAGMGSRMATRAASRGQVLTIIIGLREIVGNERELRLDVLNALLPEEFARLESTNNLDAGTAASLITWLYGLGAQDSLEPGQTPLADHAVSLLSYLAGLYEPVPELEETV